MLNNRKALEYSKENIDFVSNLCSYLFQCFPIKTFAYAKIFEDGKYLTLSNNLAWEEYHFSNINHPNHTFGKAIQEANPYSYSYLKWPPNSKEPIFQALYEFNIWHGLSILRRNSDYVECFSIATTRDTPGLTDLYDTDNILIIKRFIEYFKVNAHHVINKVSDSELGRMKNFSVDPLPDNFEDTYLDDLLLTKQPFKIGNKEIILTNQEYKCMCYLAIGNSVKEVADKIKISTRTVETYIRNISIKFGKMSKPRILELFYKSREIGNLRRTDMYLKNINAFQTNRFYINEKDYLTKQELECAKRLIIGNTVKNIADTLKISSRTVEYYIHTIKQKTGCHFKSQLIKKLLQLGIIEIETTL